MITRRSTIAYILGAAAILAVWMATDDAFGSILPEPAGAGSQSSPVPAPNLPRPCLPGVTNSAAGFGPRHFWEC